MDRVTRIGMSLVSAILLLAALSACAPEIIPSGEPGGVPTDNATPPADEPASQPTDAPTDAPAPSDEPAGEPQNIEDYPAAMGARQILAQVMWADVSEIELVSAEAVEWNDSCLGIAAPEVSCLQAITPGYLVRLSYAGDEYLFHTDEQGGLVVLAEGPAADIAEPVLTYRGTAPIGCVEAVYGLDQAAVGMCGGAKFRVPYNNPALAQNITDFNNTYTPVEASTPIGPITFAGHGDVLPGAAEQRQMAEWAQMHAVELVTGFINPSYGVLLHWERVGGIAGFCDSLTVYRDGTAVASTCTGEAVGQGLLMGEHLGPLYQWSDTLAPVDVSQSDGANVADGMTVSTSLDGLGGETASSDQIAAIDALASEVYALFQQ